MSGTNLTRVERLRRRHDKHRGHSVMAAIVVIVVIAATGTALAFFNGTTSGDAAAHAGSLVTPAPSAAVTGTGVITISWSTTGQPPGATYTVTRTSPSGATICTAVTSASCPDSGATSSGNYQYSVVASLHLWQATGTTSLISNAGAATHLAFGVQPSNTGAGVSMGPAPTVKVLDQYNNVTSSTSSIALTITTNPCGGSPTVSGGTVNAAAGTATFSSLQIIKACNGYKLTATDAADGNLAGVSNAFNITGGTAAQLVFTTQPSGAIGTGANFPIQPVVAAEDNFGNTVTSYATNVTLTKASGPSGGSLHGCTTAVTPINGVATFSGCQITGSSSYLGAYALKATGSLNVTSNIFNITTAATKVVFTTQPSSTATAGVVFAQQPVVSVEDAGSRVVTADSSSTVVLSIGSGGAGGATLGCTSTLSVQVSYGVATFAGCSIDKSSGSAYILHAVEGSHTTNSSGVTVSAGPATQLIFTQQPSSATAGNAFGTQPKVSVEDALGNVVTGDSSSVTLSITTSTPTSGGPGMLSCTANPKAAISGVVTFAGCAIDAVGSGYQLHAIDGSLTAADSGAFNVAYPPLQVVSITSTNTGSITAGASSETITFNNELNPATVPTTGTMTLSLACALFCSNTTLSIPNFTNGALDTGTSYGAWVVYGFGTKTVSYDVTLALSNGNKTITVTVGSCTANCTNASPGAAGTYQFTPDPSIADINGSNGAATFPTASSFKLF